jgi:hypothetical protein
MYFIRYPAPFTNVKLFKTFLYIKMVYEKYRHSGHLPFSVLSVKFTNILVLIFAHIRTNLF